MIRGNTNTDSTMLNYKEKIAAWLRCEEIQELDFFHEAVITLRLGEETKTGRVQLSSVNLEKKMVLCAVVGEILGGENHRKMMVDFAPMQDERFRIVADEADLDRICAKTEILKAPVSTPPED